MVLAPLTNCDTARAALGSCSTQLSTSLGSGQSFQLNLSRETSVPAAQTVQPGSSTGISAPVASTPTPAAVVSAPQPASTPKAAATPKPATTSKAVVSAKPAAISASKPAAATPVNSGCPVLDPPQARLYMPPCSSPSPAPKPAPKPSSLKPPAPAPSPTVARPAPSPPLFQTVSSPAVSTRTPSRSVTEQDEFAAQVPTPSLSISPGVVRVGADVVFQVLVSTVISAGSLLGQVAEIRFTPTAAMIYTGDNESLSGFSATHRYRDVGGYSAWAVVSYRVDYRLGSGSWVLNAATLDSPSNTLAVQVLEPRQRSLLVS